jgi:hypothetical protein
MSQPGDAAADGAQPPTPSQSSPLRSPASPAPAARRSPAPSPGGPAHPLLAPQSPLDAFHAGAAPRTSPTLSPTTALAQSAAPAAPSSSTYGSLSYAPRKRPPHLHSLSHQSAATSSGSGSGQLTPSLSSPALASQLLAPPPLHDEPRTSDAERSLALQRLKAEAQAAGLAPQSLGWAMLEQLAMGEGEWAELAALADDGQVSGRVMAKCCSG